MLYCIADFFPIIYNPRDLRISKLSYLVEVFEVCVVDMFKDEGRSTRDGILDDALKRDDVGTASQVLQDLDFSLNLFLLH